MNISDIARLYEVATDHEAAILDDLEERAGLIWTCPDLGCRWRNPEDLDACEECGTAKPDGGGAAVAPTRKAALEAALEALVATIDATGGVSVASDGLHAPVCDCDWIDLGEAYVLACAVLGRDPRIHIEEDQQHG